MLPWFATALVAFAIVLILAVTIALLPRTARTMTTRIYCPLARRDVVVQYATSDGLYPVSVISCSAFDDPRAITCGMPCVSGGVRAGAPPEGAKALDPLGG